MVEMIQYLVVLKFVHLFVTDLNQQLVVQVQLVLVVFVQNLVLLFVELEINLVFV
jgi:hypothetical protein